MTCSISSNSCSNYITLRTAAISALVASVLLVALPALSLAAQAGHLPSSCNLISSPGFCWGMNAVALCMFTTGVVLLVRSFRREEESEKPRSSPKGSPVFPEKPVVDPKKKRAIVEHGGTMPDIESTGPIRDIIGDVLPLIMKWLSPHDRTQAAQVCRAFHWAVSDPVIWKTSDYTGYLSTEMPISRSVPAHLSIGPMVFLQGSIFMPQGNGIVQYGRGLCKIKELPKIAGCSTVTRLEEIDGGLIVRGEKQGRAQGSLAVVMLKDDDWPRVSLAAKNGYLSMQDGVLLELQNNSTQMKSHPLKAKTVVIKRDLGEWKEPSTGHTLNREDDRLFLDGVELKDFTLKKNVEDFCVFDKTLALRNPKDQTIHLFNTETGEKIEADLPKLSSDEFSGFMIFQNATLLYSHDRRVDIYPLHGEKESLLQPEKVVKLSYEKGTITALLKKAKPSTTTLPFEGLHPIYVGGHALFCENNQLVLAPLSDTSKRIELVGALTIPLEEGGALTARPVVRADCFDNTLVVHYIGGEVLFFDIRTGQQPAHPPQNVRGQVHVVGDRILLSASENAFCIHDFQAPAGVCNTRLVRVAQNIAHFSYVAGKVLIQLEDGTYTCLDFVSPPPFEVGGCTVSRSFGETNITTPEKETFSLGLVDNRSYVDAQRHGEILAFQIISPKHHSLRFVHLSEQRAYEYAFDGEGSFPLFVVQPDCIVCTDAANGTTAILRLDWKGGSIPHTLVGELAQKVTALKIEETQVLYTLADGSKHAIALDAE